MKFSASKDGKTHTIDIEGPIGGYDWWTGETGVTKEKIKNELNQLKAIKADTIIVNINSYGGDVNHGFAIHDLLAQNPAKKKVYINGMTASIATVIAMAGDEIYMSDNSLFLIHRASSFAVGNANEMQAMLDTLAKVDDRIINIYEKRTKRSKDEIVAQLDVNNGTGEWLSPEEAKEQGFIDEIFEPTTAKIAAQFGNDILTKYKLPLPKKVSNNSSTELDTLRNELTETKNNIIEMKTETTNILNQIFEGLGLKKKDVKTPVIEAVEIETATGKLNIKTPKADKIASVDDVCMIGTEVAKEGEYEITADKRTIVIGAEGKIKEIKPAPAIKDESAELTTVRNDLKKANDEKTSLQATVARLTKQLDDQEKEFVDSLTEIKGAIGSTYKPKPGDPKFNNTNQPDDFEKERLERKEKYKSAKKEEKK